MKNSIKVVIIASFFILFSIVIWNSIRPQNGTTSIDSSEFEKMNPLSSSALSEWEDVNVGPIPSWFVEPTLDGIDAIPVSQSICK